MILPDLELEQFTSQPETAVNVEGISFISDVAHFVPPSPHFAGCHHEPCVLPVIVNTVQ